MTTVETVIPAPARDVARTLTDGWLYAAWVVGAARIRSVDAAWPAVGSKLHHSVGVWPLLLSDETQVLESELPGRLKLQTKGRPLGVAEVTLELSAVPGGCQVRMTEVPTSGPGVLMNNPIGLALLRARNTESLGRLSVLAARQTTEQKAAG